MELSSGLMGIEKQKNRQQPLVMVVEDNEDNLLLMSYVVESIGCKLISQNSGLSAISLAQQHQPDLIILDILMPGISGIDLIQILRKESVTSMIPVIAVTALSGIEERHRIMSEGFDDYIGKPYSIDDLEGLLYRYLSHSTVPNSA
jgi:CheY-like chemotaxis protein